MSERIRISQQTSNTNRQPLRVNPNVGIIVDMILDDVHPRVQSINNENFKKGKDTSIVGNAVIRTLGDGTSNEADLLSYPPIDSLNLDVPLIGETVELVRIGNVSYYRRLTRGFLNIGNAQENFNKNVFELTEPAKNTAAGYNTTAQTGTSGTSGTNDRDTQLGEYFSETQINRLKLYEADKLIQSRFGQSIRFSAYNNPDSAFAPTITIRNRQNELSYRDNAVGDIIEEDINRDGSTILISSPDHQVEFQPGTVDDGGTSDFETKPDHFEKYPKKLNDKDQILISSGRLIFSSRNSEMIFYSRGNYGFISDGKFSIDNGKAGAALNFNGDVKLTTNDSSTYILGGKGNIFLNTEEKEEPLVRGETLVKLLEELIDAINAQIFSTPSGPTATGPNNRATFSKIKSKLDTIKSTLNFTE